MTPAGLIEEDRLRAAAAELAAALSIKAASLDLPARNLSGGNQQKVVLAKWLMSEPSIFILDEPTRGVDVGAKFEIYTIIERLAAAGGGILFISSELDELLAVVGPHPGDEPRRDRRRVRPSGVRAWPDSRRGVPRAGGGAA